MDDRALALKRLTVAAERFVETIEGLPDDLFRRRMDGWSPRDVVAHLIGWNLSTVVGCEEILRGNPPAYLGDVDEEFRHVNDESVRRYSAEDRGGLLADLHATMDEAAAYVQSLTPSSWSASVRFRCFTISVADCFDGLRQDVDVDRRQILDWSARRQNGKEI